ncbi:hypothetical protein [Sphingomonas soli]|uniref:hypothetical protein n=1 Tax=Sphingomonas soli TaxID=266127 RepID=UPI00082D1F65|nr:hypothetical protein [Sphingomonas soli]
MLAMALLLGQVAGAQLAQSAAQQQQIPKAEQPLREEDLLLFSVTLDGRTLSETFAGYGDLGDPLLPVGELARLLGLDIAVSPQTGRATGSLGEARRPVLIDLGAGIARVNGVDIPIAPEQAGRSPTDIFLRASLLQKILPIRIEANGQELLLALTATETLPVQAAAERDQRLRQFEQRPTGADPVLRVPSSYALISAPAIDVALETGYDSRRDLTTRRYDVRAAADLLRMGFTGYLGSDERGRPSEMRMKLDRRSVEGNLLGPLGATYFALGDVFTPLTNLGPRSIGGRGFSFTTAPLGQASVFQRITLRGELPIGYQVELYVNDVLRGGQRFPVEGRYEFLDVPLTRGLNVIRIVTYGPNGERNEQTRVLNVGGGQLEPGRFTVDFGIVQQDRPVIDLSPGRTRTPAAGELRAIARMAYGLRDDLTLTAAGALYPDGLGRQRQMASFGARGSLLGIALLGELAHDFAGGSAGQLGVSWQAGGIFATLRHTEYRAHFSDETNILHDELRPLRRTTTIDTLFSVPGIGRSRIPVSVHAERAAYADGGTTWLGTGRASTSLLDTLVSTGLDYRRDTRPGGVIDERLSGNFAASRFLAYTWQSRAVVDYDIVPRTALRTFSVTADRTVSEKFGLHLGLGKRFGVQRDVQLQGGGFLHLPFGDLALTGDYATRSREWRIGLRIAFGLVFDPWSRRPTLTRSGSATGGSAAVSAFIDDDGDGVRGAGEVPVPGVVLTGGERPATTDAKGRAFVNGLGDTSAAIIHADSRAIDAFFVDSPPQDVELSARPGKIAAVPYPFRPVNEVLARLSLTRPDGRQVGVAAVRLRLVVEGAPPILASSEFDGSAVFAGVRPGTYRLELDPEQATQLHMRLKEPVTVTVDAHAAPQISAEILFGETP